MTMSDPQKVTQQRNLTTASGATWLLTSGVTALICLVMLWFMRELEPVGAATTGFVAIIVLYLAMVAVRFGVSRTRVRLWILAVLAIAIAGTFITVSSIIILGYAS